MSGAMITNTRTPQDCCKGCRWNIEVRQLPILHMEGSIGRRVEFPEPKRQCQLRVKMMFTPDCAFSPEREAERKAIATELNVYQLHQVQRCLTQSP